MLLPCSDFLTGSQFSGTCGGRLSNGGGGGVGCGVGGVGCGGGGGGGCGRAGPSGRRSAGGGGDGGPWSVKEALLQTNRKTKKTHII